MSHPTITGNIIEDNTTRGYLWYTFPPGAGIYCEGNVLIAGNTIHSNGSTGSGGGIYCRGAAIITGNIITENSSWRHGGGVCCSGGAGTITNNRISGNRAQWGGGIAYYHSKAALITNNLIEGNEAYARWQDYFGGWQGGYGGGIYCYEVIDHDSPSLISNNTIIGNTAYVAEQAGYDALGGGVCYRANTPITFRNSIFRNNEGDLGKEIFISSTNTFQDYLHISYSDVEGGQASVYVSQAVTLNWGPGMIDADPLFAAGPLGGFYLGQVGAGQGADSPCVNTGSAPSESLNLHTQTTRTDGVPDLHTADMGFHYKIPGHEPHPDTFILSGPEGRVNAPVLTFTFTALDDSDPLPDIRFSWCLDNEAWSDVTSEREASFTGLEAGSHTFQVRSMDTQGNIDPFPAIRVFFAETWQSGGAWNFFVTGPGPGPANPPLVRTPLNEWLAYGVHQYGVNVACGDLDGLEMDEVITGPGPGASHGPNVRGWFADGNPFLGMDFQAYGVQRYGVNVACGDVDNDGYDEIITGPGPGAVFGPHVRGWNCDGAAVTPIGGINFIAYGTRRWGVNVSCGDIDGDGYDEIITGAGPGAVFGPHVRGWDYDGGGPASAVPGCSFMAYGTSKFGVHVASGELEADSRDEIITGPGPGPGFKAHVRAWDYDGGTVAPMPGIGGFVYSSRYGAAVGAGDVDQDSIDEILTLPGPGPSLTAHVRAWDADGGILLPVTGVNFIAYDRWITCGGSIAGGNMHRDSGKISGRP